MKRISIIIIQILLLMFNIFLYKNIQNEKYYIEKYGLVKVLIIKIKNKGKYGTKYNIKYQNEIYYDVVGLGANLRENTFDTLNFYYNKDENKIYFKGKNNNVFNVMSVLFVLSFLLWFIPKEKFSLKW